MNKGKHFPHYPENYGDLANCWMSWQRMNGPLRFGQYMVNNYDLSGEPWPELFYCENDAKAFELCIKEMNLKEPKYHDRF